MFICDSNHIWNTMVTSLLCVYIYNNDCPVRVMIMGLLWIYTYNNNCPERAMIMGLLWVYTYNNNCPERTMITSILCVYPYNNNCPERAMITGLLWLYQYNNCPEGACTYNQPHVWYATVISLHLYIIIRLLKPYHLIYEIVASRTPCQIAIYIYSSQLPLCIEANSWTLPTTMMKSWDLSLRLVQACVQPVFLIHQPSPSIHPVIYITHHHMFCLSHCYIIHSRVWCIISPSIVNGLGRIDGNHNSRIWHKEY